MPSARGRRKGGDDYDIPVTPAPNVPDDGSGLGALASLALLHPDFRLFLVSAPTAAFPVTILQTAVKWSSEPPRGVAANLQRSFDLHIRPLLNGAATAAAAASADQASLSPGPGQASAGGASALVPAPPTRPRAATMDMPKRSARLLSRAVSTESEATPTQQAAAVPSSSSASASAISPAEQDAAAAAVARPQSRSVLVAYTSRRLATLTFALCHFHALLNERRRFGHVAFNDTSYEFADMDLDCALSTMRLMLEKDGDPGIRFQPARSVVNSTRNTTTGSDARVPDTARTDAAESPEFLSALLTHTFIRFQLADINYGGRVTDLWDQRTLRALYDFALHPYHPAAASATTINTARTQPSMTSRDESSRLVPRVDTEWTGDLVPVEEVFSATNGAVNTLASYGTVRDAELVGLNLNAAVRSLQRDARQLFSSAAVCSSMQAASAGAIGAHLKWVSSAPIEAPKVVVGQAPAAAEARSGSASGASRGRRDSLVIQAHVAQQMRSAQFAASRDRSSGGTQQVPLRCSRLHPAQDPHPVRPPSSCRALRCRPSIRPCAPQQCPSSRCVFASGAL